MDKEAGDFVQSFRTRYRDRLLQSKFMQVLEQCDVEISNLRPWVILLLLWQFTNDILLSFDPNVCAANIDDCNNS